MYVVQYEGELLRGFKVSCYPIKKVFPHFFPCSHIIRWLYKLQVTTLCHLIAKYQHCNKPGLSTTDIYSPRVRHESTVSHDGCMQVGIICDCKLNLVCMAYIGINVFIFVYFGLKEKHFAVIPDRLGSFQICSMNCACRKKALYQDFSFSLVSKARLCNFW